MYLLSTTPKNDTVNFLNTSVSHNIIVFSYLSIDCLITRKYQFVYNLAVNNGQFNPLPDFWVAEIQQGKKVLLTIYLHIKPSACMWVGVYVMFVMHSKFA